MQPCKSKGGKIAFCFYKNKVSSKCRQKCVVKRFFP
nr:MAG TPA: hypothetical protein [Caudoviricetes sp.]